MAGSIPLPYLVAIAEEVPSYPSGTHLSRVFGFGEESEARAREESEARAREAANRWCEHFEKRNGRKHHAEFSLACDHCRARGVEPKFKRKPCTKCQGRGSTPISTDPISEKIRRLFL